MEKTPIDFFFEEGKRQWTQAPKLVTTRGFYELWEKVCMPKPFPVTEQFCLAGKTLRLPAADGKLCGHAEWNEEHNCASLIIEAESWKKTWLLRFQESKPEIEELPAENFNSEQLRDQETMALFSDAVAWIREHTPEIDILKMKRKDFLAVLSHCSAGYAPGVVNPVRRMSAPTLRAYLKQTVADCPADELDLQMTLPLEGHFALAVSDSDRGGASGIRAKIPRRTHWEACRTVSFLSEISAAAMSYAREFTFSFARAEFHGMKRKDTAVLRLPSEPDAPVEENDLFSVLSTDGAPCGTFTVEIVCKDSFYGTLVSDFLDDFERNPRDYSARLQKSPRFYTAEAVRKLEDELLHDSAGELGAMNELLGLRACSFRVPPEETAELPEVLSSSQKSAWLAAVNGENPLVLIQGPPGTGKTFVLEQVLRTFVARGLNVLVSAPSNAAVDNICRRLFDLPLLRCGRSELNIAPDVAARQWCGRLDLQIRFRELQKRLQCGSIVAGTHFGLLRDDYVKNQVCRTGPCDVILFDEAGMSSLEELLLCTRLGKRAILFGDHHQLQPFPLRPQVLDTLLRSVPAVTREEKTILMRSAMEWLVRFRSFPVVMLKESFRCQNPRLLRFASILFYNAEVKPALHAEYYRLPYHTRQAMYPPETLSFYTTSELPAGLRKESITFGGSKPGLSNEAEAVICIHLFHRLLRKYSPDRISIIAPYRKQMNRIRKLLSLERVRGIRPDVSPEQWRDFLETHIATVDSFQGSESDAVIISYVRSNESSSIGFTDNPNRINVAHTRCRKELFVTGDLACLKQGARTNIFEQMERAFQRDGAIVAVTESSLRLMREEIGLPPDSGAEEDPTEKNTSSEDGEKDEFDSETARRV